LLQCAIAIENLFKELAHLKDYTNWWFLEKNYCISRWCQNQGISLTGSEGAGASMAAAAGKKKENLEEVIHL
jgi:hypothetical protein